MLDRVPSGRGPAAGDQRQGGQPQQSPAAGEAGGGAGQQGGTAAGEVDEAASNICTKFQAETLFANPTLVGHFH